MFESVNIGVVFECDKRPEPLYVCMHFTGLYINSWDTFVENVWGLIWYIAAKAQLD